VASPAAAALAPVDPEAKIVELTNEINELKIRLAVMEASNELLKDRLQFSDDLIMNLITNRAN
ncbi:MAG: hypothetical protein LBE31_05060, partial [Deltaproteobacteria bacterium]|nr:hypothetical protein [Deltaproteobacteria bacterium]